MGKRKRSRQLNIYLNGIPVGVFKKEKSGRVSFKYIESWLEEGVAISNSLPLQEDEYKGEEVNRYFDNLLPDNDEIKKKVAEKFGAESTRAYDLLEVIGRDCVGALSFVPEGKEPKDFLKLEYSELTNSKIARKLSRLSGSDPLGMEEADFRISIAGAQEKTALLRIKNKWYEPYGLTPTTHIIKKSIGALGEDINFEDSIDNEWASMAIMKKMGLPVCNVEIAKFSKHRVLVVERFDRLWKKGRKTLLRKPQEDLCQSFGISPYQKYQGDGGPGIVEISKFLRASKLDEDRFNFFKAILVFDLLYATDGHAKNFSIFIESDGFRLTPFYDVMSGYFLYAREKRPLQKLKLAMKVGDKGHYAFKRISLRHYQQTAKKCEFSDNDFEKMVTEVREACQSLNFKNSELDPKLNKETLEIILEGVTRRAKVLGF